MGIGSALVSGAFGLAGGLFGDRSRGRVNAQQMALARENLAFQREAATHGIRWRVDDAKQAGVHPLYAIGAPSFSPSPVSAFTDGGSDIAGSLAKTGQDIGRAIDTTRTKKERMEARLADLAVERGELENQMLRSKIRRLGVDQVGPPGPDAFRVKQGIVGEPLPPPKFNEFGNPVFFGPSGAWEEGYSRTPHQEVEDYWGDIPSEFWAIGNVGQRTGEWFKKKYSREEVKRLWRESSKRHKKRMQRR